MPDLTGRTVGFLTSHAWHRGARAHPAVAGRTGRRWHARAASRPESGAASSTVNARPRRPVAVYPRGPRPWTERPRAATSTLLVDPRAAR